MAKNKTDKISLYRIFFKYRKELYFFCFSVLGNTSDAKTALPRIFILTEENSESIQEFTDESIKNLLFECACEICLQFNEREVCLSTEAINEDTDYSEKIFYKLLSLSLEERLNIMASCYAQLKGYKASDTFMEFAGSKDALLSALIEIKKSVKTPKSLLPEYMRTALNKSLLKYLHVTVLFIAFLSGILLITTAVSEIFDNNTTSSNVAVLPTDVNTKTPASSTESSPTETSTARSTFTPTISSTTPTPIPTEKPKEGQKLIPYEVYYNNGMPNAAYLFAAASYELLDDDGEVLIRKTYNEHSQLVLLEEFSGSAILKTEYFYDDIGLIQKEKKYTNNVLSSETDYSYYSGGKIKKKVFNEYFADRKEISVSNYNYNEKIIEFYKDIYKDNFSYVKNSFHYYYDYDKNGFLLKQYGTYRAVSSDNSIIDRYTIFDTSGNIVEQYIENYLYKANFYYDSDNNTLLQYRQENINENALIYIYNTNSDRDSEPIIIEDVNSDSKNKPVSPSNFDIKTGKAPVLKNISLDGNFVYDINGNLLKYSYSADGVKYVISCSYNEDGLLVTESVSSFYNNTYDINNMYFTYDSSGSLKLIENDGTKYYFKDDRIIKIVSDDEYTVDFQYDNQGDIISKTMHYNNISVIFDYDSDNTMHLNSVSIENYIYYFNSKGKLEKKESYSFNGLKISYVVYEYDNLGILSVISEFSADGTKVSENIIVPQDKKDYVVNYDSDGNLMNVSGLDSKGNSFTIKFKWLDIIEENYDFYKKLSVEDLIP